MSPHRKESHTVIKAVREGAFGVPWFVIWDNREAMRIFGNDRFEFYEVLRRSRPGRKTSSCYISGLSRV